MEPERTTDTSDRETPQELWVRFSRYLVGDLTDREQADVERWLAADPHRAVAIAELRTAWEQRAEPSTAVDVERALLTVTHHIGLGDQRRSDIGSKPGTPRVRQSEARTSQMAMVKDQLLRRGVFKARPLRRWIWYTMAAVIAAVVSWQLGAHRPSGRTRSVLTYTTSNGERANITLPDGSMAALDVASHLEVPADYTTGDHTLQLSGEAIFTVLHHSETPFTVVAGGTAARVLGTSFLVRHYSTDTTTTVAVRDGKVAVGTTLVTAAHVAKVSLHGFTQLSATDGSMFSFAAGVLTLPHMTLLQAIPELDRWYAVDIRIGDSSLARVPIQGDFVAGSLSDLIRNLELGFDVRVVRDGQMLTLYPKAKR